MASDFENEREEPSNGVRESERERERVGPKRSVRYRVIVREREREGPKKRVSDRVMVRESERDRVMDRNSEKERQGVRGTV